MILSKAATTTTDARVTKTSLLVGGQRRFLCSLLSKIGFKLLIFASYLFVGGPKRLIMRNRRAAFASFRSTNKWIAVTVKAATPTPKCTSSHTPFVKVKPHTIMSESARLPRRRLFVRI